MQNNAPRKCNPKTVAQENAKKIQSKQQKHKYVTSGKLESCFLQNMHSSRSCIFLHFPPVFLQFVELLDPPKNAKHAQFQNLHFLPHVFLHFCLFFFQLHFCLHFLHVCLHVFALLFCGRIFLHVLIAFVCFFFFHFFKFWSS